MYFHVLGMSVVELIRRYCVTWGRTNVSDSVDDTHPHRHAYSHADLELSKRCVCVCVCVCTVCVFEGE